MHLTAGSHLGPYEVVEPIGAGDGRGLSGAGCAAGREVAVKVLPAD